MSKINVLDFEIANLIAAGEVVERPSSVLKELVENSIDSGATTIECEIKKGGVAIIRVTDNGCGIDPEDLPVALKRHATSKIKDKDDLETIMTLGFRGEALAAISSVSEMTIISKTAEAENATMLTSSAGKVLDISEVGAQDGTTVVVENLFGNVPARRKFLKKDATEAANVTALVEKIALSHPDISISLRIDGERKFKTSGNGNLLETIRAVFGKEFASKLIEADGEIEGIRVYGFIGRSDNVRKNRNMQNFFINGRYVKSLTAMAAIEKAYTSYIAPEAFPCCVIFIDMHPANVDVNVHPAKLEVKFTDEKQVFEAVFYTVKSALEKHEYRPEMVLGGRTVPRGNLVNAFMPVDEKVKVDQVRISDRTPTTEPRTSYVPSDTSELNFTRPMAHNPNEPLSFSSTIGRTSERAGGNVGPSSGSAPRMTPRDSVELLERYRSAEKVEEAAQTNDIIVDSAPQLSEYRIVGEVFDCYVLVESEGRLLLIDKHAAHERIIFEDLKRNQKSDKRICTQELILPLSVVLSDEEICALKDYSDDIISVGFNFNVADGYADITAIPAAISISDAEDLFVKMLDEILEGRGNPQMTDDLRKEKALYQIACKAAIKGGRIYDKSIIEWLVAKVMELKDITVCPHGRPISYVITKNELDRQFDRIK